MSVTHKPKYVATNVVVMMQYLIIRALIFTKLRCNFKIVWEDFGVCREQMLLLSM